MIATPRFLHPLKSLDWGFVLTVLALMGIGIAFIFSASSRSEGTVLTALTQRQVVWILVGLAMFTAVVIADYRKIGMSAWAAYAVGLVLLVLVLIMGKKVYGAVRWLNLFGIQIQPSEFAKLGTVIFLARFLSSPGRDMIDPRTLLQTLLIIAVPYVLILKQPDLGTASTLLPVVFVMMFVAGVPARYLLLLVLLGALAAVPGWFLLGDYQRERIHVFFDPSRDPLGTGWNSIQSGIAVGSGGLTGKGFMMGTQNILGFLPRTVAPTDFIFSVIGEEMGFMGSFVLLALFAALVVGCLRAALASRDKLGRVLSVGVVSLLFSHIFVNMAMTVGLMPITGLPLPLVSYGGSFMMSTMLGLGLVQSVYVRRIRR
jgi:rod shape determining protein RodA